MTRPKPITDPHQGQLAVVVSFRIKPHPGGTTEDIRLGLLDVLVNDLAATEGDVDDLTVAIREIGAGGEHSEMEGQGP